MKKKMSFVFFLLTILFYLHDTQTNYWKKSNKKISCGGREERPISKCDPYKKFLREMLFDVQ